jgi:hypothetical protein
MLSYDLNLPGRQAGAKMCDPDKSGQAATEVDRSTKAHNIIINLQIKSFQNSKLIYLSSPFAPALKL